MKPSNKILTVNRNHKNIDQKYFEDYGGMPYSQNYLNYTYPPMRILSDLKDSGITIESLLDLGCASGELVRDFRNLGVRAYGIDNNKEILNQNVIPQFCVHMDMTDLSTIKPNTFDCIYTNSLMYLYPNEILPTLQGIYPIVKKAVYLCTPFKGETELDSDPYRKFLASPTWWDKQFKEAGFFKTACSTVYSKQY